ncbi:IS3 family transposase [Limosilactobacillus fermentum]
MGIAKILAAIRQIEKRHLNCAGYRKVTAILNSDTSKIKEYTFSFDFPINIKRVRRIMRNQIEADIRQPRRNRVKERQTSALKTMYYIASLPLTSLIRSG